MDEIKQARRARRVEARRAAIQLWASRFSYAVEVRWPHGFVGTLLGITILLCPVWLLVAATWLASRAWRAAEDDSSWDDERW
jgi:hypothetical protein